MHLDPAWLMLSLVVSGIGYVLFQYGRKQVRMPQLLAGVALMVYPYFTPGTVALASVGLLICVLLYLFLQLGW